MVTPPPRIGTRLEHVPVRGALSWRDSYLAWIRRHPLLTDTALVAVLFWLSRPPLTGIHGSHQAWAAALVPALLLPLVWRRRAPFPVFLIIFAAALVQWFTSPQMTDDIALLVAFYTVAAYEPARRALIAVGMLETGGVLLVLRYVASGTMQAWFWALLTGLVAAAGLTGYYTRTRRARLASLVERAERLERERDREAQLAAAAERARIAREMHDIVAHNIAVMIALAEGAAYTTRKDPDQAVNLMGQVSSTGRSALAEMRRLLGVLRQQGRTPGHKPQPTLADVAELLGTVRAAGLPVRLAVTGQPSTLPPSAELALYRMIQEALTNTLKHAAATSARIRLSYLPGEVGLEVTDDGRPGARQAGPGDGGNGQAGTGHGLAGMRERAAVFGGQVSAGPIPGGGWRVHTVLHVEPVPADGGHIIQAEGA
jgi:signal transduction histidine kinase